MEGDNNQQEEPKNPLAPTMFLDIRNPIFDCKDAINEITEGIKEGRIDPLKAAVILKRMEKISEEVKKNPVVKELIKREADKYISGSIKSFEYFGAKISVMATYTWYDFKDCGHEELTKLKEIQEQVDARIKIIEAELKLLIPKENSGMKFGQIDFGISATKKGVLVERVPRLEWDEVNEICYVEPPRKIQDIGLKFMKV